MKKVLVEYSPVKDSRFNHYGTFDLPMNGDYSGSKTLDTLHSLVSRGITIGSFYISEHQRYYRFTVEEPKLTKGQELAEKIERMLDSSGVTVSALKEAIIGAVDGVKPIKNRYVHLECCEDCEKVFKEVGKYKIEDGKINHGPLGPHLTDKVNVHIQGLVPRGGFYHANFSYRYEVK